MRILFTCHDVGSALQNLAFIKNCERQNFHFDFIVIVAGPAAKVFSFSSINDGKIKIFKNMSVGKLTEKVSLEVKNFLPDFVLLGLTSSGNFLDVITRKICFDYGVRCGVIQDYWGYLGNYEKSSLPDYFFVFDEEAKRLSEKNAGQNLKCFSFGSPKHESYQHFVKTWSKINPFFKKKGTNILYVGQPSSIEGVFENFLIFHSTMQRIKDEFNIYFKPHPLDNDYLFKYRAQLINLPHFVEILEPTDEIEPALINADLIVTCFSTAGFDHNYLQFFSDKPLGDLVYLTVGEKILKNLEQVVGEPFIPSAKIGLGQVCISKNEFNQFMETFSYKNRELYFKVVKQNLSKYTNASQRIYSKIRSISKF